MKDKYVIIVAGGKGERMGVEIPKQFLLLYGKPILMRTIEVFFRYDNRINIVVVLPESQRSYWQELCKDYEFDIFHQVVNGGKNRFESVRNGLELVPEGISTVAIHDGVRPLVSVDLIERSFTKAQKNGCAFPVILVVDTLRKREEIRSVTVDRSAYCLVQTPQVFSSDIIKEAYLQPYSPFFTDDVSVVESLHKYHVYEIEGARENIKITTPFDLLVAEAILTQRHNL